MTELKPCPFCGGPAELRQGGKFASCKNTQYWWSADYPVEYWNTRPIEDALRAEYNDLVNMYEADTENLRKRLENALSNIEHLKWRIREEANQFNLGHDAFFNHIPIDNEPYFDVSFDTWRIGWVWAQSIQRDKEAQK